MCDGPPFARGYYYLLPYIKPKTLNTAVTVGGSEKWKFKPTALFPAIPAATFVSKISADLFRVRS
jgi:hypothetical protein